jgi:hypothetical protein
LKIIDKRNINPLTIYCRQLTTSKTEGLIFLSGQTRWSARPESESICFSIRKIRTVDFLERLSWRRTHRLPQSGRHADGSVLYGRIG